MGNLIIPKNDGRLEYFDESISIVAENGGIITTEEFVSKEKQSHPEIDETSCYHKIVMARYFGLILFNTYSSYYFLTEAGSKYSRAKNKSEKIDAILHALQAVTFGRNNNAVSSDSDIEAPVVFLKALVRMEMASITQLGSVIYCMDKQDMPLEQAIEIVSRHPNIAGFRKDIASEAGGNKYFDLKFNKLFEDLGIIEKTDGKYVLSEYVKQKHMNGIMQLAELKCSVIGEAQNEEDYVGSQAENALEKNVVAEDVNGELSVEQLGEILAHMYNSSSSKTTAIHMFGIKYAPIIREKGYTSVAIIAASGIGDSYHVEVSKGVRIYESILSNEYGIAFYDGETLKIDEKEEPQKVVLPQREARENKIHPLNSIIYGAPGTGKTYSTAEYAQAIIEGITLEDFQKKNLDRKTVMERYNTLIDEKQIVFTTFHQSYGYEEFIQGLRPDVNSEKMAFKVVDGVFKQIADRALDNPDKNYVIIIDEINRANISKVFGELITLIEDDKRWGEINQISVTLQLGDLFAVPNNLYIVGTMNSADKSISLIDVALRRRFEFIEQKPDASLVVDPTLQDVLLKLNDSLVNQLDSTDLLIGHSYFMNKTEADLPRILNNSIIPLLYEYFYDNKKKVVSVLEESMKSKDYIVEDDKIGRVCIERHK